MGQPETAKTAAPRRQGEAAPLPLSGFPCEQDGLFARSCAWYNQGRHKTGCAEAHGEI